MCFANDAEPPSPSDAGPAVSGDPLILTTSDGTARLAWRAEAVEPTGAGVVILPDVRGLFSYYQRLAGIFAALGLDAVAIDYFGRTAGIEPRDSEFDFMSHARQATPDGVVADIAAGVAELRSGGRVRSVFLVGFCFGGSYAFLQVANVELGLAGVIGFYGGMRPRQEGADTPITLAPRARVPVLGLFGGADESIPAAQVDAFAAGLDRSGVAHDVHVYPGAPHSFFDRSHADHVSQCQDAWRRMRAFIDAHSTGKAAEVPRTAG